MAKRQRLIAAATLLTVVACSDTDNGTLGPPVTDPSANVTTVDLDGTNAFVSDICGPVDVSSGDLAGTQIASPCDGDFANSDGEFPDADGDGYPDEALDPAKLPFTGATWFLSSIDASPSPTPPNFGGLASRLKVRAFPYPDRDWCEDSANTAGGTGNDCAEFDLPAVVEVTDGAGTSLSYRTDFKTNKKKGGGGAGRYVPAESYWQLVVYFDFDGNNQFADTEDIASRIVKATETPSTDNPLNGWSLDIQRGSNQPVPFVIEDDGGCFGEAVGFQFASCFVDFARGFRIAVLTGDGEGLVLSAGPGNDHVGTQLVSGEVCEDGSIDVPVEVDGTCITFWVGDESSPEVVTGLVDTWITSCEALNNPDGIYVFAGQDDDGTFLLWPGESSDAAAECADLEAQLALAEPDTGIHWVLNRVKQIFAPRTLNATDGTTRGGTSRLGTDYQLIETAQMQAETATSQTVAENTPTTLQAIVKDHENESGHANPVSNAVIEVYGDASVTVSCTFGPSSAPEANGAWCEDLVAPFPTGWSSGVQVNTGSDGIVEVEASAAASGEVRMLACTIAVPGSDYQSGALPQPEWCDGNPDDEDIINGHANGIFPNRVDPFMRDGEAEIQWANDIPLVFSLQVCSAPNIDGLRNDQDPWSNGSPSECIPSLYKGSFEVNVGNNLGGATMADLEWMIAPDEYGDLRLYFGLAIPMSADPTSKKVNVAVEFDKGSAGDASGTSDVYDDQIEINVDKSVTATFDRYIKQGCTNSTSVCNSLDSEVGGNNDVVGAMAYNGPQGSGFLFVELSQVLETDDEKVAGTVDRKPDLNGFSNLNAAVQLGFIMQFGVGNVQQGGTIFPAQSGGGKTYKTFTINP